MNEEKNIPETGTMVAGIAMLVAFLFVWWDVLAIRAPNGTHAYFLDVGQGDAELVVFPNGVKVMTDAGPDASVLRSLGAVVPSWDRHIDLAIISHPQLDHFNGYNFLLDRYSFGAFIYNGRDDSPTVREWPALLRKINEKHIPLITAGGGDVVHVGSGEVDFLSPSRIVDESAELNDTGLVERVRAKDLSILLTADIGSNIETLLLGKNDDITADVLKVPHHGSRFSSSDAFLRAVRPSVAAIEVGLHNKYGHPTRETLERLARSTAAQVMRTDRDGTVEVFREEGIIHVKTGR